MNPDCDGEFFLYFPVTLKVNYAKVFGVFNRRSTQNERLNLDGLLIKEVLASLIRLP